MNICPACGGAQFQQRQSAAEIARDIDLRSAFIDDMLDHRPEPAERMDLTDFMHGGPGRLLSCTRCGLIIRDEGTTAHYEDDVYDPDLLQHLYPRYLTAFRRKEAKYRDLLPPGAAVVEIGSHLGAFLETAEEWDWQPIGLDVGENTTRFAQRRGLTVRRTTAEDVRFRHRVQGVFLWNCFEQLPHPRSTLIAAHRFLRQHGLLVVRVPNVEFYERCRRRGWTRQLGYNNLLAFPYQYGYPVPALLRVLSASGFQPVLGYDSTLVTLPVPDPPRWMEREWRSMDRQVERLRTQRDTSPQTVAGPWIEIVCRSVV
jgi:hypothetical protein